MSLFSGKGQEANLRSTVKMVEEVIAELGLEPSANRIETDTGGPAWALMKGSAQVFVFINPSAADEEWHGLQVVSPVVALPEVPAKRAALLRHLLELNARGLGGAAFGLKGETVILCADRSTRGLSRSEVRELILRLGHYADLHDDALATQFGATRHSDVG